MLLQYYTYKITILRKTESMFKSRNKYIISKYKTYQEVRSHDICFHKKIKICVCFKMVFKTDITIKIVVYPIITLKRINIFVGYILFLPSV